jgi:hypothetical protein
MAFTVLAGCSGGTCPTVYAHPDLADDVLVQGEVVPEDVSSALGIPAGEVLVRVPRSLLTRVPDA